MFQEGGFESSHRAAVTTGRAIHARSHSPHRSLHVLYKRPQREVMLPSGGTNKTPFNRMSGPRVHSRHTDGRKELSAQQAGPVWFIEVQFLSNVYFLPTAKNGSLFSLSLSWQLTIPYGFLFKPPSSSPGRLANRPGAVVDNICRQL